MKTPSKRIAEVERAAQISGKVVLSPGAPRKWIDRAQENLRLKFPPSLEAFLLNHSGGVVRGLELYGLNTDPNDLLPGSDLVYMTQQRRCGGLQDKWLAIFDDQGDRCYFLDCGVPGVEGAVFVEDLEIEPHWKPVAPDYLAFVLGLIAREI